MLRKSPRTKHHGAGVAPAYSSLILIACLSLFSLTPPAHAAVVWFGDIDPDDPTTWDTNTNGYIGKYGVGTMDISAGSGVLDYHGCIGRFTNSTGEVTVNGADSTWTNSYSLTVGHYGSGTLNITSGGEVINGFGCIGYNSGSTGVVTVDGTDSTWTNSSNLRVGYEGSGTLNITNGGLVSVEGDTFVALPSGSPGTIHFDNGTLTTGGLFCASNDLTGTGTINTHGLVSDVGLIFNATYGLNQILNIAHNPGQNITVNLNVDGSSAMGAGCDGIGTMSISDGRIIESTYGYIGYKYGSTGVVTVDGTDSTWTNSSNLHVGYEGSGTLNITGGGEVSSRSGFIGNEPGSTGVVTVDGTDSTWTNSSNLSVGYEGSGTLNITNGGLVSVEGDTFVAFPSGSSGTIHFDNGTLETNGLFCASDDLTGTGTINTHGLVSDVDLIFNATYGLNQILNIAHNPGQNITVNLNVDGSSAMGVGYDGVGTMSISDGRVIESTLGIIGWESSSTGVVTVDGAGSTWTNSRELCVGYVGSGTLHITDGGAVSNNCGFIGYDSGATGEVTVDGTGSTWTNSNDLHVGSGTLNVTDGGTVSNSSGYIGNGSNLTGEVTIDGVGSTWTNSRELCVGCVGSGTLHITNGGAVNSNGGNIGSTSAVTVDGTGSIWTNSSSLCVGGYSGSSTLNITGGGAVAVDGYTRVYPLGAIYFDNGTLTTDSLDCAPDDLTGTGTINTHGLVSDVDLVFNATYGLNQILNLAGNPGQNITINLNVDGSGAMGAGYSGVGTINISEGRVIESTLGVIGYKSSSTGAVTVDGAGSTWTNSSLYIGHSGSGTLNITGGGAVSNSLGCIGYNSGSTGEVTVDGAGSTWTNRSKLYVGGYYGSHYGSGMLNITGGGAVSNSDHGYIGYCSGSTGQVTVDGAGSMWTNSRRLYVGYYGSGTLNITGGAVSNSDHGYIGYCSGSTGQVTVDGAGSTWTNNDLTVGYYGSGTLNITGGGAVSNGPGYIGHNSGSTGEVTVDGAGSTWTNRSKLYVGGYYGGHYGSGTLNITGGGAVSNSDHGYIGYCSGSTGQVTVDGADSTWMNSGSLYVGGSGSGTLNITAGGAVSNRDGYIGDRCGSTGTVTVDGAGSTWTNSSSLIVGRSGSGTLNITDGGLVSVAGGLTINQYAHNDSFINMATGGMLALFGDADDSLGDFLGLVGGSDAIRYWDDSVSDWADIMGATYGDDYTLGYLVGGCLDGYTVLSVGAPEPGMVGDATNDGEVNAADAAVLAAYWQTASGALWGMGDFNGDGAVNDIDATLLAANWGNSTNAAVPEPSMLVGLLALCLAGLLAWARRR